MRISMTTARSVAIATIVVGLSSVLAAVTGIGGARADGGAMPDSCQTENLNQCSLQIWPRNSFPHRGVTQSDTFSNGETLTCTSNGANTPRTCSLSPAPGGSGGQRAGNQGSGNAAAPDVSLTPRAPINTPSDPSDLALRQQCSDAEQHLSDLIALRDNLQPSVDRDRAYYQQAEQMTPLMLRQEIQRLQSLPQNNSNALRLRVLSDLYATATRPQMKGAAGQQMQVADDQNMRARLTQIVDEQQASADYQRALYDQQISGLRDRIAGKCGNVNR